MAAAVTSTARRLGTEVRRWLQSGRLDSRPTRTYETQPWPAPPVGGARAALAAAPTVPGTPCPPAVFHPARAAAARAPFEGMTQHGKTAMTTADRAGLHDQCSPTILTRHDVAYRHEKAGDCI